MCVRRFFVIVALIVYSTAYSQEISIPSGGNPLSRQADSLMQTSKFSDALPIYLKLAERYPKDQNYQYAIGVCYLNGTRRMDLAVKHLTQASTGEVPNKVYFYLAEALRLSYRFNEAIDYYRRFTINGGAPEIKNDYIEKQVTLCENGSFMLRYLYEPEVIDKKALKESNFHQFYSIIPGTGSFVGKPTDLMTPTDRRQNEKSVLFYPRNPNVGDYLYYASYGSTTTFGKDIFRIQKLEDGYWSKPENLGDVINSSDDEDFPYLAPDGVTLYFASKGHYSMGGYDLYRSVYDPQSRKWSTPENLGFPFSSPFDDYLYVPDARDSLACFATNRNVQPDSVELVVFRINRNPLRHSFVSYDEIEAISKLNAPGQTPQGKGSIQMVENQRKEEKKAETPKPKTTSFSAVENDPEYMRVIAKGFSEQMKADSLKAKLENLRSRFDYITTAEERRKLESQVVKVEDALLAAQKEADDMFARASQIEQEFLTGKRKPAQEAASSFATDNPEFLYQAQFANTVFRSDEIARLAQIEKLQSQINTARDEAFDSKSKYTTCLQQSTDTTNAKCSAEYRLMLGKMRVYNDLLSKWFEGKYKLYTDCTPVALAKSDNNNAEEAKAEIARAQEHFRAAQAIKNNLGEEGKTESLFEAMLLQEIGICRVELAFAKIWGMKLFEQQTTSKTLRLEKMAFGKTLPPVSPKARRDEVPVAVKTVQSQNPIIQQTAIPSNPEPILFKKDEPPSFQVLEQSPYNDQNPIPMDEALPDGVLYKIQLIALSNPKDPSFFRGMAPLTGERVSAGKVTKYYVGKFRTLAEAEKYLPVAKSKGFREAFVVAWYNGKPITIQRAQSLENEPIQNSPQAETAAPANDPTARVYLVQIGRFAGKLPDDLQKTVRALAPGKDITRKQDDQGRFVYSISSYSVEADAIRVKDNLIASGIPDAMVIPLVLDKK
jgi:hypothetical protein